MTATSTFTIRDFTEDDYPALARILREVNPNYPATAESLQHEYTSLRESAVNPHIRLWLAEQSGEAIGMAGLWQFPGMFHPDRYSADVAIRPAFRHQGTGTALARVLETHLQERGAKEILAGAYENWPDSLNFLARYGFTEVMRFFDNVLDLSSVNFADWQSEMALSGGLRALSFADLQRELGAEQATRAYYDAFAEARADVPRTGEATEFTHDDFRKRFETPRACPDLIYLALTPAGEVVALSELWNSDAGPHRLEIGLTGTRRQWRRKGLALALKLHGMQAAHAQGVGELWTGNATTNVPMLALNERLGFKPRTAWIEMKRGSV